MLNLAILIFAIYTIIQRTSGLKSTTKFLNDPTLVITKDIPQEDRHTTKIVMTLVTIIDLVLFTLIVAHFRVPLLTYIFMINVGFYLYNLAFYNYTVSHQAPFSPETNLAVAIMDYLVELIFLIFIIILAL